MNAAPHGLSVVTGAGGARLRRYKVAATACRVAFHVRISVFRNRSGSIAAHSGKTKLQSRCAAMPSKEVARITDKAQSYLDEAQRLVAEYGKVGGLLCCCQDSPS